MPAFLTVLDAWALAFHFPRTTSRMVFIQKFGDPCCFCPRRKNSRVCGVGRCVNGGGGGEKQGVLQMGTLLCPSLGFSCPQVIISYISLSYLVPSLISPFSSFSEKKKRRGKSDCKLWQGVCVLFLILFNENHFIKAEKPDSQLQIKHLSTNTTVSARTFFLYIMSLNTVI